LSWTIHFESSTSIHGSLEATTNMEVYGPPNDEVLGMMTQLASLGVPVSAKPRHLAGFTRSCRRVSGRLRHVEDDAVLCSECRREVDEFTAIAERWGFWSDGCGELLPFCPECDRREFAPDAPASRISAQRGLP